MPLVEAKAAPSAGSEVGIEYGLLSTGRRRADLAAAQAIVRSLGEISPQLLRDLIDRGLST